MKTNILKVFGFAALLGVAQGAFATVVTTEAQLRDALTQGGTIDLGADITLSDELCVSNTVVLNLGTYRISSPESSIFQVVSNGNFTVNADASNPGGLYADEYACCIYTSYGWNPGPKTIVINGGVFQGNCFFNWSPTAAANMSEVLGFDVGGEGSGEKAVPTSVTINGGTFCGGYGGGDDDLLPSNIGEYRCYYFTVNGGTFEKGIDCADTLMCAIGATTTCKAFFKGGRYRNYYPFRRTHDEGKVFIGDGTSEYVYYIDGDYYAIGPNYATCAYKGLIRANTVIDCGLIEYLFTRAHQKWSLESELTEWYFKTYGDAIAWNAQNIQPANGVSNDEGDSTMSAPVNAPVMARMMSAPMLLASSGAEERPCDKWADENDVLVTNPDNAYNDGYVQFEFKKFSGSGYDYEHFYDPADKVSPFSGIKNIESCWIFDYKRDGVLPKDDPHKDYFMYIALTFDREVAENSIEVLMAPNDIPTHSGSYSANRWIVPGGTQYFCLKTDWENNCPIVDLYWPIGAQFSTEKGTVHDLPLMVALRDATGKNAGVTAKVELRLVKGVEVTRTVKVGPINRQVTTIEAPEDPAGATDFYTRAYFTHTFGSVVPEVEKKCGEVATPDMNKVIYHTEESGFDVIDENGEPINLGEKQGEGTPADVVAAALETIRTSPVTEAIKADTADQSKISEVPTEAEARATDFNKWLRRETVGIAIDTSAAVAKLDSISFEVEPLIETIVEDGEGNKTKTEPKKISNEEIKASGKSIKVILPLSDDFRVSAKVRHESEDPNYPPEEFICPVLGVAGGRYVEIMTTHFSTFILSPYNAVVTESDETLGIVKVAKTAGGETVAGVPFRKFDATSGAAKAMTVDQLLVAGFGQDDDIYAYNPAKPSGDEYDMWAWDGEKWSGVLGQAEPPAAESAAIASGKAFWFKDESGSTTPLTLAGLYQENVTTTVDVGKKSLLVNPYPVAINAAEKLKEGACAGDQFALVGGSDRYEFRDGAWGVVAKGEVITELPGGIKIYGSDTFTAKDVIEIPAGQAFWYISTGATAPTVAW